MGLAEYRDGILSEVTLIGFWYWHFVALYHNGVSIPPRGIWRTGIPPI